MAKVVGIAKQPTYALSLDHLIARGHWPGRSRADGGEGSGVAGRYAFRSRADC
jgi:hypothetical protein